MIDEGIDVNHSDLRDNIWTNSGEVSGNRVDDDNNGYVDDVNGYDFANDDATVYDPEPISGKGDEHGTHVVGTIAAAGNGGSDGVGDDNDAAPHYPASYDVPNVVSVVATGDTDRLASFSNFGATSVDLAAPGVGILSTLPGDRYGCFSGTSMATPHVAGVAALIESQQPGPAEDAEIRSQLLRYVDEKTSLQGRVATSGQLNAAGSLTQSGDTTKPRVTSPRPAPGGSTRDRTPNIAATVSDAETEIQQDAIKLSLDGNARGNFSYDAGTDCLTYIPPRLAFGRHKVEVVAEDEAGNVTTYTWGFKVVR